VKLGLGDGRPGLTTLRRQALGDVDRVRLVLPEAALCDKTQKMRVASMAIDQDDPVQTVAADLIQHPFQQRQQEFGFQRHAPRKAACLIDLPKVPLRKDHRRLALRRQARNTVSVQHVRTQRQVRAVTLQHAQRQQAHARLLHGCPEIIGCELLPLHGDLSFWYTDDVRCAETAGAILAGAGRAVEGGSHG
jgi:hypothetical protein